jgi:hypothetical protein
MRPFTTKQLCILAETYCAATGKPLSALSDEITDKKNHKLFSRLIDGQTCTAENAERASLWFAENWPADLRWPKGVPAALPGEAA